MGQIITHVLVMHDWRYFSVWQGTGEDVCMDGQRLLVQR